MKNILFVSQEIENKTICGIGVIGNLIGQTVAKSKKYNIKHIFSDSPEKVLNYYNEHKPEIIFYNFAAPTMPWVADSSWKNNLDCEHVLVYHDGNQNLADSFHPDHWFGFKYMVTDDPTLDTHSSKYFFTTRRLIAPFSPTKAYVENEYPVIGFQGQLVPHKGLPRIITQVQNEFKKAKIRLHCPHYHYGSGEQVWRTTLQHTLAHLTNPDIEIEINTEIFTDQQIVDFLAENTVNCYFYDYLDQCGLASSPDYALAAKRPFCITKSFQFRHFWDNDPTILIENTTIKQVIENGMKPFDKYYEEYTEDNVIKDYESIIETILSN
jgi:hypothetical protein